MAAIQWPLCAYYPAIRDVLTKALRERQRLRIYFLDEEGNYCGDILEGYLSFTAAKELLVVADLRCKTGRLFPEQRLQTARLEELSADGALLRVLESSGDPDSVPRGTPAFRALVAQGLVQRKQQRRKRQIELEVPMRISFTVVEELGNERQFRGEIRKEIDMRRQRSVPLTISDELARRLTAQVKTTAQEEAEKKRQKQALQEKKSPRRRVCAI